MIATIRFAHASRLHLALFFTPNPFRNTGLYDLFVNAGKLPSLSSTIDYEYYGAPFNGSEVSDTRYRIALPLGVLRLFISIRCVSGA